MNPPTRLTDEQRAELVKLLASGGNVITALNQLGLSDDQIEPVLREIAASGLVPHTLLAMRSAVRTAMFRAAVKGDVNAQEAFLRAVLPEELVLPTRVGDELDRYSDSELINLAKQWDVPVPEEILTEVENDED